MSQPAGYSGTPLPQKLGIGPGDTVALIGAPGWLEDALAEVPGVADIHTDLDYALYDVIVVFVSWRAELEAELGRLRDPKAPARGRGVAGSEKATEVPPGISREGRARAALPTRLGDKTGWATREGVGEVRGGSHARVGAQVPHAGRLQLLPGRLELVRGDRDRQVLHPADGLGERRMIVAREVEEPEQVAVPDVEEEVVGAGVVAVLHELHQREAEELLIEPDSLLGVPADPGEAMHAPNGGRRPLSSRMQGARPKPLPAATGSLELATVLWGHRPRPFMCARSLLRGGGSKGGRPPWN